VAVFARASSIDRAEMAESGLAHFRNFSFPFWIEPIDVNSYGNRPEFISPEFSADALYLPLNLALVRDIVAADGGADGGPRFESRHPRHPWRVTRFCLPDPSKTASQPR
jgi:hypothetical protein